MVRAATNLKQNGQPLRVARLPWNHYGSGLRDFGRLGLERVLRELDQLTERNRVRRREIGNDFPVEFALGGLQPFDEATVSNPGCAGRGVDARLPEVTERALLDATIAIGVLPTVIHGIGGVAIKFGAFEAKAFGRLQHTVATFSGGGRVSYSHKMVSVAGQ